MPSVGVFAVIQDDCGRILLTKIRYGSGNWTLPGGRLERNESPFDGVRREVIEETGYIIEVDHLVSVYSAPSKDDLVLLFKASIVDKKEWIPDEEIEKVDFFDLVDLPSDMHCWNRRRIQDAIDGEKSQLRIFE